MCIPGSVGRVRNKDEYIEKHLMSMLIRWRLCDAVYYDLETTLSFSYGFIKLEKLLINSASVKTIFFF